MTICICVMWYFPNGSALKFYVVSISLFEGLGGVEALEHIWRFLVSMVYVDYSLVTIICF